MQRLLLLVGRRGGKDRFLSAVAVWRAALCADWREYMSAGETATVLLLGVDKRQAAIMRRYCEGLLQAPLLAAEVLRCNDDVIEFRNGAALEINTNDLRLGPGPQRGCGAWLRNLLLARGRGVGVERRRGGCGCHAEAWRCVLTAGCWRLASSVYRKSRLHVSPLAGVARQRRQRRYLLARAIVGDEPEAACQCGREGAARRPGAGGGGVSERSGAAISRTFCLPTLSRRPSTLESTSGVRCKAEIISLMRMPLGELVPTVLLFRWRTASRMAWWCWTRCAGARHGLCRKQWSASLRRCWRATAYAAYG